MRLFYYDPEWRKNPNAVYVARGSRWGNPYRIEDYGRDVCLQKYREWLSAKMKEDPGFLEPLRGKDLVCYCPPNKRCHTDIIAEVLNHIANP